MSISEHFRYRNDVFQSDIFVSEIGITDVDVGCWISPTLRSMSMPTYAKNHWQWWFAVARRRLGIAELFTPQFLGEQLAIGIQRKQEPVHQSESAFIRSWWDMVVTVFCNLRDDVKRVWRRTKPGQRPTTQLTQPEPYETAECAI